MKRLIIEDKEKKKILGMYGIISEQTDEEILNYINKYVDTHDCKQIADDMESIKGTETYANLDEENKKTFNQVIYGLRNPVAGCGILLIGFNPLERGSACRALKNYMKEKFREELPTKREIIKSQICAFSYLWTAVPPPPGCSKTNKPEETNSENTSDSESSGSSIETLPPSESESSSQIDFDVPTPVENPKEDGGGAESNSTDELDTVKKIQDFQTWMDKNYGKWAYSKRYKRYYSVNQRPNYGYGTLGPNTRREWANKKDLYLNKSKDGGDKSNEKIDTEAGDTDELTIN